MYNLQKKEFEKGYPTVGIDLDLNSTADWKTDFLTLTQTDFYQKFKKPTLILCNPPFNGQKTSKTKRTKRDYSKCFLCGSENLWSGEKQKFCLECRQPASKCLTKNFRGLPTGYCSSNSCPRCHHQGKKDYFSICYACYEKAPLENTGRRVDWNWIIEKQKEVESKTKSASRLGSEVY